MNIVILPADRVIQVDGVVVHSDSVAFPTGIHAIHWDGKTGAIERPKKKQEIINSFSKYQYLITEHASVLAAEAQAKIDSAAAMEQKRISDAALAEATLTAVQRRLRDYPPVADQLEALYDARHGDTTKLLAIDVAIAATKTKYPL